MSKGPEWLLGELPGLQADGVIDAVTAERLRLRYADAAAARPVLARVLFAAVGALLIGLGVILLVAHNWDQWPRGLRLAAAFLPLLLGQGACAWALQRAPGSVAWAEGAALFTATAFAAALALVGQIFHFPGDLDRYLLTCALAALPLVYLLRASGLAALVALVLLAWVQAQPWGEHQPLLTALLYATLLPHALWAWRQGAERFRSLFLAAWLVPTAFFAILIALPGGLRMGWLWFAEVAALLWLFDRSPQGLPELHLRRPVPSYGLLGVGATALAGAFADFWQHGHEWGGVPGPRMDQAWIIVLLTLAAVLWGFLQALRRRAWLRAAGVVPALVLWLSLAVDPAPYAALLAVLFNLYVLGLGVALIRQGLAQRSMRGANLGLSLIASLVLMRFFDGDWSFTVRGLAFMAVGIGFLLANLWLKRRVGP